MVQKYHAIKLVHFLVKLNHTIQDERAQITCELDLNAHVVYRFKYQPLKGCLPLP